MQSVLVGLSTIAVAYGSNCNGISLDFGTLPADTCFMLNSVYSYEYDCDTELYNLYLNSTDCNGTFTTTSFAGMGVSATCNKTDCDYVTTTMNYGGLISTGGYALEDCVNSSMVSGTYSQYECCYNDVCLYLYSDEDCTIPYLRDGFSLSNYMGNSTNYTVPSQCNMTTTEALSTTEYTSECNSARMYYQGLPLSAPTDVCFGKVNGSAVSSTMYNCTTGMLHTYATVDCTGRYRESLANMECDAEDCDYAILREYEAESNTTCSSTDYHETGISALCTAATISTGGSSFEAGLDIYCNANNESIVSAAIYFSTSCGGSALNTYPDAMDAFATFDSTLRTDCMDFTCNLAPTPMPTEDPTVDEGDGDSALRATVGVVSALLMATVLLK